MSNGKINSEGTLLFEQPFTRVPYENYRKVFRTQQKHVEREFTAMQSSSKDLMSKVKGGSLTSEEAAKSLDGMISRVQTLKRKLSELHENSGKPTQDVMRERLNHLAAVENMQSTGDPEFGRWADTRLDRWLVDWSLRNGMEVSAKKIAKQRNIETLVDIDLFTDIRRIENALKEHSCTEALAWCNENKSALRKIKNTLEFDLRLQEYIELARERKLEEARTYSGKYLAVSPWKESHIGQIHKAATLLIFPPSTTCTPYRELYKKSRWRILVNSFRAAIYTLNTLSSEPLLHLALYAGLASLKLSACYDHETKNVDCPVCDGDSSGKERQGLGVLAEEVPLSHHQNSTIVCYITGKIMNEDNTPMAFENGYVYSREAMEEMAAKNGGMVTCPRTNLTCEYLKLKKVYIS